MPDTVIAGPGTTYTRRRVPVQPRERFIMSPGRPYRELGCRPKKSSLHGIIRGPRLLDDSFRPGLDYLTVWSPSAITSRPIRSRRMFQTKVPVVEPKSTKVTVPLKAGFGRVEDILFG